MVRASEIWGSDRPGRGLGTGGASSQTAKLPDHQTAGQQDSQTSRSWDPATGQYLDEELPPDILEMMKAPGQASQKPGESVNASDSSSLNHSCKVPAGPHKSEGGFGIHSSLKNPLKNNVQADGTRTDSPLLNGSALSALLNGSTISSLLNSSARTTSQSKWPTSSWKARQAEEDWQAWGSNTKKGVFEMHSALKNPLQNVKADGTSNNVSLSNSSSNTRLRSSWSNSSWDAWEAGGAWEAWEGWGSDTPERGFGAHSVMKTPEKNVKARNWETATDQHFDEDLPVFFQEQTESVNESRAKAASLQSSPSLPQKLRHDWTQPAATHWKAAYGAPARKPTQGAWDAKGNGETKAWDAEGMWETGAWTAKGSWENGAWDEEAVAWGERPIALVPKESWGNEAWNDKGSRGTGAWDAKGSREAGARAPHLRVKEEDEDKEGELMRVKEEDDKEGESGAARVLVHLDEVLYLSKVDVRQGDPEDREVFFENLPPGELGDGGQLDLCLTGFGPVESVFRLSDISKAGLRVARLGNAGYVRFINHKHAANCVISGVAAWSESARAIRQYRESYGTEGALAKLLGPEKDELELIRCESGVKSLKLRGDELEDAQISSRVHFFAEGDDLSFAKLMNVLKETFNVQKPESTPQTKVCAPQTQVGTQQTQEGAPQTQRGALQAHIGAPQKHAGEHHLNRNVESSGPRLATTSTRVAAAFERNKSQSPFDVDRAPRVSSSSALNESDNPATKAFFKGLKSELSPEEDALANAIVDFLKKWKNLGKRPNLIHLGTDPEVREHKAAVLPKAVNIRTWIERRIGQEVMICRDAKGLVFVRHRDDEPDGEEVMEDPPAKRQKMT